MTVINLQKDLEVLYAPRPEFFHNGRNKLMDLSGNGRHAEASGGPTISENGYRDFGEAEFDGGDDYFQASTLLFLNSSKSDFAQFKADSLSGKNMIVNNETNNPLGGFSFFVKDGNLTYQLHSDGDFTNSVTWGDVQTDTWYNAVVYWDESDLYLFVNGDLKDKTSAGSTESNGANNYSIGFRPQNDYNYFDGRVGVVGRWSRALSDAEIAYLNRLTDWPTAQV